MQSYLSPLSPMSSMAPSPPSMLYPGSSSSIGGIDPIRGGMSPLGTGLGPLGGGMGALGNGMDSLRGSVDPMRASMSSSMDPMRGGINSIDPVRASVGHLLQRAYTLPCSTAAQAFAHIVQPIARFQLALDVLLPLLEQQDPPAEPAQRILVSFILYSLYAPHPITINPFKSALFATFAKERDAAVAVSNSGGVSPNEQLVWVLWKILKGDGNDIGPYSPATLARSPLPAQLRSSNLILDEKLYINVYDIDDSIYSSAPAQSATQEDESRNTADAANDAALAHAMQLFVAARERVLTLSEQRQILPQIPALAASGIVTTPDLPPLVQYNPVVAHPLLVTLLTNSDSPIPSPVLDVLPTLAPRLQTLDLMGRLLRDGTMTAIEREAVGQDLSASPTSSTLRGHVKSPKAEDGQRKLTVGELVRVEVLDRFVHEAIEYLDAVEREATGDDRHAQGVVHLCRFYHSLIKLGIVDPADEVGSAEMMHFSLRNARYEEANAVYRVLAMGGRGEGF
ncbi:hypothetical protein K525DRAFT_258202 [Schizophyllum commune Loenen D]|nr:hypothetical protein K525DRAFT_258202 [Schizophyllum commune Loenen D]